jgi:hypothetical protein
MNDNLVSNEIKNKKFLLSKFQVNQKILLWAIVIICFTLFIISTYLFLQNQQLTNQLNIQKLKKTQTQKNTNTSATPITIGLTEPLDIPYPTPILTIIPADPSGKWIKYSDDSNNFTLSYDSSWKAQIYKYQQPASIAFNDEFFIYKDYPFDKTKNLGIDYFGSFSIAFAKNVDIPLEKWLIVNKPNSQDTIYSSFTDWLNDLTQNKNTGTSFDGKKVIIIAGEKAVEIDTTFNQFVTKDIYFKHNNNLFNINYRCGSKVPSCEGTIKKVITSIKFIN